MTAALTLEEQIAELRQFHLLREQATDLRERGLERLKENKYEKGVPGWDTPGDPVEQALLVCAFADSKAPEYLKEQRKALETLTLANVFDAPTNVTNPQIDRVPVLKAANALVGLATSPGLTLSAGAIRCYYRILYELKRAAKPDELLGGATSGSERAPQTAFITWRCVAALAAFAAGFQATADLVSEYEKTTRAFPPEAPQLWVKARQDAAQLRYELVRQRCSGSLVIDPDLAMRGQLLKEMAAAIKAALASFDVSAAKTGTFPLCLVELASRPDDELDELKTALEQVKSASETSDAKQVVASLLAAKKTVQKSLGLTRLFFRSVLHQELVAREIQPQRVPDAAELLFAAAGMSHLDSGARTAMVEADLTKALDKVADLMTNSGRVPSHKPFNVAPKGYVLHVAGSDVLKAFAELARNCDYPLRLETAQRMYAHYYETWRDDVAGWRHERDRPESNCQWWLSALTVDSLRSYVRMLDRRINAIVCADLSVRQGKALQKTVDELVYPDYALRIAKQRKTNIETDLIRMLAHLQGTEVLEVDGSKQQRLFSAILHGPPGTGKTFLVEAVAKSANLPLIEITPSDILLGGEEKVETRARVVFEALSMLTDAVILLDEFDRVLWARGEAQQGAIFQFLTPGMLPKLKKLRDQAKKQRVVFVLSTNLIGGLDEAAIRDGRFDEPIGVFPPDALSRAGALAVAAEDLTKPPDFDARFTTVVNETAGRGMQAMGKDGWLTKPKKAKGILDGTPQQYLAGLSPTLPELPPIEKKRPSSHTGDYQSRKTAPQYGASTNDASGEETNKSFPNEHALREWRAWCLVDILDKWHADEPNVWKDVDVFQEAWGDAWKKLRELSKVEDALTEFPVPKLSASSAHDPNKRP